MAVLEALAAGLPVILSPGCNLPEAESQGAGLIVLPDEILLAEALANLVNDAARRAMMGDQAQRWARETFAWPSIVQQLDRIYENL